MIVGYFLIARSEKRISLFMVPAATLNLVSRVPGILCAHFNRDNYFEYILN